MRFGWLAVTAVAMVALDWRVAAQENKAQEGKSQESKSSPSKPSEMLPRFTQKVVEVKHADVRQLADLVSTGGGLIVRPNDYFRTISLGGSEAQVNEAEELIKRFDTPRTASTPRTVTRNNIEVVFYMLIAAPKGTAGDALPPELDPVAKQLKQVFAYNDFRLLDSAVLRAREGDKGETSGNASFVGGPGAPIALYQLRFGRSGVSLTEKGNVIRLDDVRFSIRAPYSTGGGSYQFTDIGLTTHLDIREGQKVVVGKAKYDGSDSALVLVVTAKVVD